MQSRLDVIVIGGGQAGLAMGYFLARQGLRFAILDAAPVVGHVWRSRWDSLRLFTPAEYDSLPGLPFPGPSGYYPGKEEVADYLETYARTFDLPLWLDEPVVSLRRCDAGAYAVRTDYGEYAAGQVVVATGAFHRPHIPALAADLPPGIHQLHSSGYRNPAALPEGDVLVVGAGNSGIQIAVELSRTRRTRLAVGTRLPALPERLLGRSLFWWVERTGLMGVPADTRIGRRLSAREAVIGTSVAAAASRHGVELLGRVTSASAEGLTMADGAGIRPRVVVWATGYRPDYDWIDLPVLDDAGRPLQRRGVTPCAGVYFLGLPWMHSRGSSLLGWVGRDAEYVSRCITQHRRAETGVAAPSR